MKTLHLLFLVSATTSVLAAPVAEPLPLPSPTGILSASSAKTKLVALTVGTYGADQDYDRALFPHWYAQTYLTIRIIPLKQYRISQSGSCDTREVVLKRDGTGIVQNSTCAATSGTWKSPYDGATWSASSDVDIDHMVPLENAWNSGASEWTTPQRQAYANDLVRPQLWTVTDNVNESKGSRSPDAWKPPLALFYCTYAESWVVVKFYYKLTATKVEVAALGDMLETC